MANSCEDPKRVMNMTSAISNLLTTSGAETADHPEMIALNQQVLQSILI